MDQSLASCSVLQGYHLQWFFLPTQANDSNCSLHIFIKAQNQAESDIPIWRGTSRCHWGKPCSSHLIIALGFACLWPSPTRWQKWWVGWWVVLVPSPFRFFGNSFNFPDNKPYRYDYHTIIQWWPLLKESLSFYMVKFFKNSPYTLLVSLFFFSILFKENFTFTKDLHSFFLILQFYFHIYSLFISIHWEKYL